MLLAIDCGNTNVVFTVFDGDDVKGVWRAATAAPRTTDEYGVWLTQLLKASDIEPGDITGAILASVVPDETRPLRELCEKYFDKSPLVIGDPNVDLGLTVKTDQPRQVGADMLVNAVSAYALHGGPVIVVDFGTATTFQVTDASGDFTGAIIAPGINLSMQALYTAAAQLPKMDVKKPEHNSVIGTDTVSAMQSGVFWGYIGLIEGLLARLRGELGEDIKVVATGGLAPLFADTTAAIDEVDGNLTMTGLRLIYARNTA